VSRVTVLASSREAANEAARRIARAAREAIVERGRFDLAVPGGRSAAALFDALVRQGAGKMSWERTQLWFVDERAVSPADPDSNFALALERLIEPLVIRGTNVHRMPAEAADLAAAASEYAAQLPESLDVAVLGVGEDGHVASLFPGSAALPDSAARVAVVTDSPKPPARRLTLTPRALSAARTLLLLAFGRDKANAVSRSLAPLADPASAPAARFSDAEWIVDRAAAGDRG
jgi:6-phosphogluconolactonase